MKKVENQQKNSTIKVEFAVDVNKKTTKTEKDILFLLTTEYLTIKQVAVKRGCSIQNIYKIVSSLKSKGVLNKTFFKVENSEGYIQPKQKIQPNQQIRLHGQQFRINILYVDHRYKEILKKSNYLEIDGNTIKLNRDSVEIYSNTSFFADNPQKATARSMEYWTKMIRRLENDLNLILLKPRSQNIKIVKSGEYAEINNELAKECHKKTEKIRIYTNDDGKLWFMIDNSFNLHEMETVHPETSQPDIENILKHFNDIRDHDPPTMSEIMMIIKDLSTQHQEMILINKETASGLNSLVEYMRSQLPKDYVDITPKEKPDYFG